MTKLKWGRDLLLYIKNLRRRRTMNELVIPELKSYAKTILGMAPNTKRVCIYNCDTKVQAQKKSDRLKSWPYKVIVKARDTKGRFAKGYALICCK